MKKVFQAKTNDCLCACLASLLEIPLTEVPKFPLTSGEIQQKAVQKWLKPRGLNLLSINLMDARWDSIMPWCKLDRTYCIVDVAYKGYGIRHAVIGVASGHTLKLVHNPARDWGRLKGRPSMVNFLVPLDIGKWLNCSA